MVEPVETTFMEFILKKQSILLTFLLLLTLIFTSCLNNVDQPSQNGTITFAFTTADLDRITGRAAESDYSVEIYLSVNGEIIQKSTSISNGTVAPITFTDIRIGASVAAIATINLNGNPVARGESNQITIKEGENRLTIRFTRVNTNGGNNPNGGGNDEDDEGGNNDNGTGGNNDNGAGGNSSGGGGNNSDPNNPEQDPDSCIFTADSNHPIILWNNRTSENELIIDGTTGDVAAQAISGSSFTRGAKVYSQASANMQITSAELPSNVYCFGDDCIYAVRLEGQTVSSSDPFNPGITIETYELTTAAIEKYISSGSGFVKDNTFTDIDVKTLFDASSVVTGTSCPLVDVRSIAYAELNGSEYFFIGYYQIDTSHNLTLTGCCAIDPSNLIIYGSSPASQRWSSHIPAIEARSNGSSIDLYFAQEDEGNNQTIQSLHVTGFSYVSGDNYMIDGSGVRASPSEVIDLSSEVTSLGITSSTTIGGLKLDGDTLYVTLYTNDPASSPIVCNGGIAKLDLSGTPAFTNWSNGEKVLGWYKDSGVTVQPPRPQQNHYFYRPTKIITQRTNSLGQNVLIVADDGAYIDAVWNGSDVSSISSYNMNRIVTVNLTTDYVSAYNVNVCFDNSVFSEVSQIYTQQGMVDILIFGVSSQ